MSLKTRIPLLKEVTSFTLLFTMQAAIAVEFLPAQTIEVGGQTPKYVSADFNADGFDDVAVVVPNKNSPGYHVNFITGSDDPDFPLQDNTLALSLKVQQIITGDFNGDGAIDLMFSHYAVANSGDPESIAVYFGTGSQFEFEFAGSHTNIPSAHTPSIQKIIVFDANNDGLDDLLVDEHVRLSSGDGSFYQDSAIDYTSLGSWVHVSPTYRRYVYPKLSLAEVNGDGIRDIVIDRYSAHCGVGDGTYISCPYELNNQFEVNTTDWPEALIQELTSSNTILMTADFNGDEITDAVTTVLTGTFTFDVSVPQPDGLPCPIVQGWRPYFDRGHWETRRGSIYDCTPQPNITVTVRAPKTVGMQVSLMNADGSIASQVINHTYELDTARIQSFATNRLVRLANSIGRGGPYLTTNYIGINQSNLYDYNNAIYFSNDYLTSSAYGTGSVVDANNDGMMDIFVHMHSTKQLHISQGDGHFIESQEPILKTAPVSNSKLADYNGNGFLDISSLHLPAESDHTLQVQFQRVPSSLAAPVDPTPTDPVIVNPDPESSSLTIIDQIEMVGVVSEAGANYFIVNNTRIDIVPFSIIKFEDGFGPVINAGDPVDVKANKYSNGSAIAIKAQFGG